MSKLSFRARALDPSKPMPIFLAEELPDLPEYSAINRAVPQMPSGMEKEEESEHHLQRAICTGLIIPTPEVFMIDQGFFDRNYPANYKMPRQMIHMQPLGLEQDIPDYDMDSADEIWVNQQGRRLDLTPLKFEQMMDRLEKSSGQVVATLNDAKALLKQDDEVSIAVYDYWLNKRLKTQHPLILSVKTENRPGASANNPYLAFRRRTEKMQTRKNRKNDETSYEKMLKLKRDLQRAVTLLDLVKRREKTKREHLHLSVEIFEKRYQARDFSGSLLAELSSTVKNSRPAFAPLYTNQYSHHSSVSSATQAGGLISATSSGSHHYSTSQYLNSTSSMAAIDSINANSGSTRREKRQYKKRKHKLHSRDKPQQPQTHQYLSVQSASPTAHESNIETEEEDLAGNPLGGSEGEDDGLYAFRRNKHCEYNKPRTTQYGNWPWESKEDGGFGDSKYRFTLASIRHPRPRCIGFGRRRVGRGGRIILDRASTNMDEFWSQLDYTVLDSRTNSNRTKSANCNSSPLTAIRKTEQIAHDEDEYDENVSRDPLYVSASTERIIQCPSQHESHYIHPNSYRTKQDNSSSISNISNCLLSKEIKPEPQTEDSGSEWTTVDSATTASGADGGAPDLIVDLVRTHCKNNSTSSSNNNLNNRNYFNLNLNNNRTVVNNDKLNVIKQETILKQEAVEDDDEENSMESSGVNILDDENVNLARLSRVIHANRIQSTTTINSPDLIGDQRRHSQRLLHSTALELDRVKSGSPFDDSFIDEIQREWLHFRPKTPEPLPLEDDQMTAVEFSDQTPISIEIQRLGATSPSSVLTSTSELFAPVDPLFVTKPFTYSELQGDESFILKQMQSPTTQPNADTSNAGMDFNLSGESLNELNLSLGECEDSEKMLDNILQECQIDDLKALNQTTNFWNGILDDGNGILDCIDDKKAAEEGKDPRNVAKRKATAQISRMGSSTFIESARQEKFFKKEEPKTDLNETVKIEPPDEILASPPPPSVKQPVPVQPLQQQQTNVCTLTLNPVPTTIPMQHQQTVHQSSHHSQLVHPQQIATQHQVLRHLNHQQQHQKQLVTPAVTQIIATSNNLQQHLVPPPTIATKNQQSRIIATSLAAGHQQIGQKIYIKQEPGGQVVPTSLGQNAVITLSNVKLENDQTATQTMLTDGGILTTNAVGQQSQLIVTAAPKQSQHQQHILLQPINAQGQPGQIINVTNAAALATDASGTFVLAGGSPIKRHLNGPTDRNAIQNIISRKLINRKFHIAPQQPGQQQQIHMIKQEDDGSRSGSPKPPSTSGGNFIKMNSYPVVVSELNVQPNPLSAAVAANHNYSLQPSAQPITIISSQGQQQGNKIILSTSGGSNSVTGSGNFTISEMPNKIHYKEIPASNLKVNFLTTAGSLVVDPTKNSTSNAGQQTTSHGLVTQQQQPHSQQRLNKVNMFIESDPKRVLYTKLVSLSSLQHKNNSGGQTVQVSPGTAQIINKAHNVQRLGNTPAIFTNMRSIPVGNHMVAASPAGAGGLVNVGNTATDSANKSTNNTNNSNDASSTSSTGGGGGGAAAPVAVNLNTTNR